MKKRMLIVGHCSSEDRQRWLFEAEAFRDYETGIAVPQKWGHRKNKAFKSKNIKVVPLKCYFSGQIGRYFLNGLDNLIEEFKPGVIYCQAEPWSAEAFQCAHYSKKYSVPLILYAFENLMQVYKRRDNRYFGISRILERYTLRNTRLIIAGNAAAAKIARKRGFTGKITILPISGINTGLFNKYKKNTKKKWGLDGKRVVLFLGRIEREKGIYDIAKSIKKVSDKIKNIFFLFVGSGSELANLKKYTIDNDLSDYAGFIGRLSYSKVPDIMNAADVFVYPSQTTKYWAEQFGFSIAEALSCGLPVITTKSGAIPEWFGKYVSLIEEQNPEMLARAIIKALNKKNAAKKYKNQYSLSKIAKQTKNIFVEC